MGENIISSSKGIIIINGGDPLPGCPQNWDDAYKWEEKANADREEFEGPTWKWDCGFKLDYDGPLLRVSSRFYPPKTHYGPKWDGYITVLLGNEEILSKEIETDTLDELKLAAEKFVDRYMIELVSKLKSGE